MVAPRVLDLVVEASLLIRMATNLQTSVAVIIFVRHPELGKVKTRLAKTIGDEKALQVYNRLLEHTLVISKSINATKFVFYADEVQKKDLWNEPGYFRCKQKGADLGDRMKNAFSFIFQQRFRKVIVIGSDCYLLRSDIIETAINSLGNSDMVIGPAVDGGYYLLGMNKLYPEVFENKSWSSDLVAAQTIEDTKRLGLKLRMLDTLSDIDEFEDLAASGMQID